jgi:hypothetical protein
LRTGNKKLKDIWRMTTFEDVEIGIGDVFLHALKQVRYLDGISSIVARRLRPHSSRNDRPAVRPHPRSSSSNRAPRGYTLKTGLFDFRAGLFPGQYVEIERQMAIQNYVR